MLRSLLLMVVLTICLQVVHFLTCTKQLTLVLLQIGTSHNLENVNQIFLLCVWNFGMAGSITGKSLTIQDRAMKSYKSLKICLLIMHMLTSTCSTVVPTLVSITVPTSTMMLMHKAMELLQQVMTTVLF